MICKKCGAEMGEEKLCPSCGTPVEETAVEETVVEETVTEETITEESVAGEAAAEATTVEEAPAEQASEEAVSVQEEVEEEEVSEKETTNSSDEEKKSIFERFKALSKNAQLGIVTGAVLVVVIIILIACSGGKKYGFKEYGKGYYELASSNLMFNLDGTTVEADEYVRRVYNSADGSMTAFLDSENTLFVIDKKGKSTKVADDVDGVSVSMYGNTIAYVKDAEDYVGELLLYNVSKNKSTRIDKEAYSEILILSPDGKSVAYVGNCEVESGWFSNVMEGDLFLSKGGKSGEKLYSDSVPIAITNNGKNVFYVKDSEKLYMNDEKIASDITSGTFAFNKSNSELIYNKDGNSYYYTLKSKEAIKLKGERFYSLLTPESTIANSCTSDNFNIIGYGVDTFNETLVSLGGSVYYLSDKGENVERAISSISSFQMTNDGKSVLFLDYSGGLKYIKNITKSLVTEVIGEDLEADAFVASDDLDKVYYICDDELFYLNKGKGVRIADDVDAVVYSDKYGVVYFTSEEELFYAKTKAKSKERVMGEYVAGMEETGENIIFGYTDDDDSDEFSVYTITGKSKTKEILTVEE